MVGNVYKIKYKAVKVGEERVIAANETVAKKLVKGMVEKHIQGDVRVRIVDIKEM